MWGFKSYTDVRIEVPVDETTLRPVTVESPLPEDMAALFD